MKDYLAPEEGYKHYKSDLSLNDGWIEIPEDAETVTYSNAKHCECILFWKKNHDTGSRVRNVILDPKCADKGWFAGGNDLQGHLESDSYQGRIIWQRNQSKAKQLISGIEAKKAWANGSQIQTLTQSGDNAWRDLINSEATLDIFESPLFFRIKPKTIVINGIEVPAPEHPQKGEWFYYLSPEHRNGYAKGRFPDDNVKLLGQFGSWLDEFDIQEVVKAYRSFVQENGQ